MELDAYQKTFSTITALCKVIGKIKDYSGKKLSSRFPVGLTSADLDIPRLLHTGGYCFGSADVCEVVLGEKVEGQRKHSGI